MTDLQERINSLIAELASPQLATIDLSLTRMLRLMEVLDNPQHRLPPAIHVAGTNGKGSLLAYLAAIFESGGYKAHRYISPHLMRFNERIQLAGADIADEPLLPALEKVRDATKTVPVTSFEATTAAAFVAFAGHPADVLLLETGLGGRLDATNILPRPALTAITPISLDHREYLGDTLASIAGEKAGILKQGVTCIVGPQPAEALMEIECIAKEKDIILYRHGIEWNIESAQDGLVYRSAAGELRVPHPALPGRHQFQNAGTAIACIEQLKGFALLPGCIGGGIASASWPARLQRLSAGALADMLPPGAELWLDGGHNEGAAAVLAEWASGRGRPVHLICGMLRTKDVGAFLALLAPHAGSIAAVPIAREPLARPPEEILVAALQTGSEARVANSIKDAIEYIVMNNENPIILICGSLSLAGNSLWQNSTATQNPA